MVGNMSAMENQIDNLINGTNQYIICYIKNRHKRIMAVMRFREDRNVMLLFKMIILQYNH